MLERLKEVEKLLPAMLRKPELWGSIVINRAKPLTYRIFTNYDGLRICLHKFIAFDKGQAYLHPHPWAAAFKILKGSYEMEIGRSINKFTEPLDVTKVVLTPGSSYEIIHPMTFHSVHPLEDTYTFMVNGPDWDLELTHLQVKRTANKGLNPLTDEEKKVIMGEFQDLVGD